MLHQQLIDRLTSDLVKIKTRKTVRPTSNSKRIKDGTASVSLAEFTDVKRRVDDLYRRIDRGGR